MKNRCGYCESKDKDVVCWECLKEMLEAIQADLDTLKERYEKHWHDVTEMEGYGLCTYTTDDRECQAE